MGNGIDRGASPNGIGTEEAGEALHHTSRETTMKVTAVGSVWQRMVCAGVHRKMVSGARIEAAPRGGDLGTLIKVARSFLTCPGAVIEPSPLSGSAYSPTPPRTNPDRLVVTPIGGCERSTAAFRLMGVQVPRACLSAFSFPCFESCCSCSPGERDVRPMRGAARGRGFIGMGIFLGCAPHEAFHTMRPFEAI